MALCHITGTVYLPDGTLATNRTLVFVRQNKNIVAAFLGSVLPESVSTTTDANGQISVDLVTGVYGIFSMVDNIGRGVGISTVPDQESADFEDTLKTIPDSGTPAPPWFQDIVNDINTLQNPPYLAYPSREAAEAGRVVAAATIINVDGLLYRDDPNGTALVTGDGRTWSPAGIPTSRHFGGLGLVGVDDAEAIQAALDYAKNSTSRKVVISGMPAVSHIALPGNLDITFEGPVTAVTEDGFTITVAQDGTVQRNSVVRGLMLNGNNNADGGVLCTAAQYWSFYDPVIAGYNKPGAWAFVFSGNESNQNASSNQIFNPNFANCSNLLRLGKNPNIVGSQNTGASFNTVYGGYLGPFGDNTDNIQRGVWDEVGEGNKFFNTRVSTNKHHTIAWDVMDARIQCIGCAGDGPCFTAFVYPLSGPGQIDSIALLGTPLLETPVAWAGGRMATAEAVVAQIEADGNQYPNTEFLSLAHDEQVMFFRVDADGNKVRLNTNEIGSITVEASGGIAYGHSGINQGLLQGPPYAAFPDVTTNKWGYRAGHGGVLEVYSFFFRANPEGSGRGGGSLYEPEGNGPRHIVWFDDEVTQRSTNVVQAGVNILGGGMMTTDAVQQNLDGGIQVAVTSGNGTIAHAQQRLRTINFGPMVFAEISLRFTPTFTTNGQLYFEFPQREGLANIIDPLDVNGMQYNIPITISGTSLDQQPYLSVFGGQVSPNGHPFARLMTAQGTIVTTSVMTSGQEVSIRGWGHWPVNRFS